MSEPPSIEVLFADQFKRQLRTLAKRYRQIQTDLQPLLQQLQTGECPGDRISGTGYTVFKVISNPAASELLATKMSPRQCRLPTILLGRDARHSRSPRLSCLSATGIDIRAKNSDISKGKSGGDRIIYQVTSTTCFILLIIYAKSDQETVAVEEINDVIDSFRERQQSQSINNIS